MKVKVGSVIIGFIMICIGIAALAGQTPVFGIHPIVWFILGVMLICSDSAWEKLAHAKRHEHKRKDAGEGHAPSNAPDEAPASGAASETPEEKAASAQAETSKAAHTASAGEAPNGPTPSNGTIPSAAEDDAAANGGPVRAAAPSDPSGEGEPK